jgi:hypothetical protein
VVRRATRVFAVVAATVLALGASFPASARSADPVRRRVAQVTGPENRRIVVSEGEGKTARLLGELEQELKASSYVVIRVPKIAFEPEVMLKTLQDAQASRGILLSDDAKTVMVLAATSTPGSLRVYAEYLLNHDNRLARRRQWIALVERMRVSMEEEQNADHAEQQPSAVAPSEPKSSSWRSAETGPLDLAELPAETPAERPSTTAVEQAGESLGASVALGYITGRTGLTSHLLLNGYHRLTPRLSLAAQVLWPMVQSERSSDGEHSRVWSFIGAFGLMAEPARPSARVNPYLALTVGMQFLLAYVDRSNQAITDVYHVASLTLDSQMGIRVRIHAGTWLVVQASAGRAIALSTASGDITRSLADTWGFRAAVGLLMAL